MNFEEPKQPKNPEDVFQAPHAQRINETTEEYRAANPEFTAAQNQQHQEKMTQAETKKENQQPTPEQLKAQQERDQASQMVAAHFSGKSKIPDGILTSEETQVLSQMEILYKQQKSANPDQPVKFGLDDKSNEIYARILHRLPLAIQEHGHTQKDQTKADEIREKLGLEKQHQEAAPQLQEVEENYNLQDSGIKKATGETRGNNQPSEIESQKYSEFKQEHGKTSEFAGGEKVYWWAHTNKKAEEMQQSGELKWGKERIYFDIPLNEMINLRDVLMATASQSNIPITFKFLDTEKTPEQHTNDKEATRFVANFASVDDAKKFYNILSQNKEYQNFKSDRNLDYQGHNIDGVAHYASGYREARAPLKKYIESAVKNPDGTYTFDKLKGEGKITVPESQFNEYLKQYQSMPDPKDVWENTKV